MNNQLHWHAQPLSLSTVLEAPEPTSFPSDLSVLSTDELVLLSSRCFRQLDRKHPVRDALVQYYAIAQELEIREACDGAEGAALPSPSPPATPV